MFRSLKMANKSQVPIDDDDDTLDDFAGDADFESSSDSDLDADVDTGPCGDIHFNARRAIERRNELKKLQMELDDWDTSFDEEEW